MPRPANPDAPLTPAEYAALVGFTVETVQLHCAAGRIPGAVKVLGTRWRIPRSAVPDGLRPVPVPETAAERAARGRAARARIRAMRAAPRG